MPKPSKKSNDYTAKQIQVLEGLDPVRKRPGMYIGSTDQVGLHHLITEIVNNSVDEALAGFCDQVEVIFRKNNSIVIRDNGRGIPVEIMSRFKKSALEICMTRLHAGGKFGDTGGYKVSGGLHGVGASVVNALSEWMRVEVEKNNKIFVQEYERGEPKADVQEIRESQSLSKALEKEFELKNQKSGTTTVFLPDKKIFADVQSNFETISAQLKEYAYLTPGVTFYILDDRSDKPKRHTYHFKGGIVEFVQNLNKNKTVLNDPPFYLHKEQKDCEVEIALQYNDGFNENVLSYANNVRTIEGGYHLTGFRSALTRSLNDYAKKQNLWKNHKENNSSTKNGFAGDDVREGLTAVISVKIPISKLQFEGQTKTKLGNSEVRPLVDSLMKETFDYYLEEHPKEAQAIIQKNMLARKARLAARQAKELVVRKSALESGILPGKLADCQEKSPAKCELFIVEGDSAGGSAKQARSRQFQAVLPLFGKILNTERARIDRIVDSEKLKPLIVAVGAGIADQFDIEKLRYHRLIIMADADVDGSHIKTLYLTFFYRHLKEIVEQGYVYAAVPPLYKAILGKEKYYLADDQEKEEFINHHQGQKFDIQRFKGLGEMNAEELWETTMNPETRRLKKITVEDAQRADEMFTVLMGEEVLPRKEFIQTYAKHAELDV